jgi:hypothetical protein
MVKRKAALFVVMAALLACSCTNYAEVARARAEAEAARAEADAVRAKAAKAELEMVSRWNAVADGLPADVPNFGKVTFHWDGSHFPHPTFKGGSGEAYGAFAQVLLAFFKQGDNFDYLAANHLFTVNLRSGIPGGPNGPDTGWTLAQLADRFTGPEAIGTHDEATHKALKSFSDRIEAHLKEQEKGKP